MGLGYDPSGNLKYDTFNTYTWDGYQKLASVDPGASQATCGSSGWCLTNDALGRIVEVNASGSYTEILYSPIGKTAIMNGQTATKVWYPMPGGGTVLASSTNWPHYQHKDWLGSGRLQTEFSSTLGNSARTVDYDRSFAPYGEMYGSTGNDAYDLDFTGDVKTMWSSGLLDTENREYHPNQGRWISPDPAGTGWNQYAYPTNPNSATDPTGLFCAYLNDAGNGVQEIDDDPGAQASCGGNGGYWISGSYGGGSRVFADADSGTVVGIGYDSSGNPEVSRAGAMGTSTWGAWTQNFGTGPALAMMNAANNGFTLGIRAPGQTYKQCLAANSNAYSINDWLPSSWQSGGTKFALGNDVSNALFGDAAEGTAGLAVGAGAAAMPIAAGAPLTAGARTSSFMALNLAGKPGPGAMILGKTGAKEVIGWVSGAFELKLAVDVGATAAEMLNCIGHR